MRLIGCISTYESSKTLSKTLESIKSFVDHVIVVDGPYIGWPKSENSVKETTITGSSIYHDIGIPCHYVRLPAMSQAEKRNHYLQWPWLEHDDWLFIIDDDEILVKEEATRDILQLMGDYATVEVDNMWMGVISPQNRLIKWRPGLRYYPNHWTIQTWNGETYCQNASPPFHLVPLIIRNNPSIRSPEWRHKRALYRMLRFIAGPDWRENKFETGKPDGYYTPESAKNLLKSLAIKISENPNEFDTAFFGTLAWIWKGCEQDIVWSPRTKAQVLAALFSWGVIPNCYSSD